MSEVDEFMSRLMSNLDGSRDAKIAALVKALKLARARIEYLGVACTDPKHYDANEKTFLPAIDELLASVGTGSRP